MQSTVKLHDSGASYPIAPEVTFEPRAVQASPDPVHEVLSLLSRRRAQSVPDVARPELQAAAEVTPAVDTTFRASNVDPARTAGSRSALGSWARKASFAFVFALCSAVAAAIWTHHRHEAQKMISAWMPLFTPAVLAPSQAPADAPAAVQAAADSATAQPALAAQPDGTAPVAAAPSADSQLLTSMAHDLAAMGQQIEELKASIAQLKDSQAQMSREVAKNLETIAAEKVAAVPPRPAAVAPVRRPKPAPPAATASSVPPPYYPAYPAPPPPMPAPPPPQTMVQPNGEPVVRPPMPLR